MVHIMDKGFLGWGHHNNNQRKFTDILRQYQQQGEYKLDALKSIRVCTYYGTGTLLYHRSTFLLRRSSSKGSNVCPYVRPCVSKLKF